MIEPDFNEPLNTEPDGTYITAGQLQFFLNRRGGNKKFKRGDLEFFDYYNLCRVYNLVSKIMESDWESAIIYWDDRKEIVSMGFPTDGVVALAISSLAPHVFKYEEDDDDDSWGLWANNPNYDNG